MGADTVITYLTARCCIALDGSTCLFYDSAKTVDYSKIDVKKLKVGELKAILSDWGEQCRGCSEKSDYVKLVEELLPKHVPDAGKAKTDL